jgi:uncharacterized protein YjbJ (UPF0337 family)
MDENRIGGTVRNVGGKVEEGLGRATGDVKSQVEGKLKQAAGTAQDLYGQAMDGAADAADAVRKGASSAEDYVRNTIETRPYTALLAALAVGWLLGRTGRGNYY